MRRALGGSWGRHPPVRFTVLRSGEKERGRVAVLTSWGLLISQSWLGRTGWRTGVSRYPALTLTTGGHSERRGLEETPRRLEVVVLR